jgi:non-ribosomal peptide synthetase component F
MTVSDARSASKEIAGAELLPARRIHELFETLAALVPGAPAVIAAGERLTYGELDRQANRLARYLRSLGLGTEERVAVALDRSLEAVVALLAVWKAGGAWIPLDLSWPSSHLGLLLEESGATFLIAREESAAALAAAAPPWPLPGAGELPPLWQLRIVRLDRDAAEIAGQSAAPLRSTAGPDHLACILDPAGPERSAGVMLKHRELVHRAVAWMPGGRPGTGHRVLRLAAGRAVSLEEILLTLPQGAALDLSPAERPLGESCGRLLKEHAITHLLVPPELASKLGSFEALDFEVVAGHPFSLLPEPAVRALTGLLGSRPDAGTDRD